MLADPINSLRGISKGEEISKAKSTRPNGCWLTTVAPSSGGWLTCTVMAQCQYLQWLLFQSSPIPEAYYPWEHTHTPATTHTHISHRLLPTWKWSYELAFLANDLTSDKEGNCRRHLVCVCVFDFWRGAWVWWVTNSVGCCYSYSGIHTQTDQDAASYKTISSSMNGWETDHQVCLFL